MTQNSKQSQNIKKKKSVSDFHNSTFSEKGDQECPGHDFVMSRSAVRYVSSKSEA